MEPQRTPTGAPTRRLLRSRDERMIGGVCGGLGEYTGIDPVVFRIVLAVAALAGGAGLAAYLVAWVCIPERNADGSEPPARSGPPQIDNVAAVVLGVLGLVVLLGFVGGDGGPFDSDGGFLLLVLVGLGVWWWVRQERDEVPGPPAASTVTPRPPAAATSYDDPLLAEAAALDDLLTVPVGSVPPPPPAPPREPRSKLPLLGMSALLLLWGGLVLVDVSGAVEVDAQVAIGLSLVVIGGVLVLGAWYGRAHALVALGVVLTIVGGLSSVADTSPRGGFGDRTWQATSTEDLRETYRLGGGDAALDLSDLELTEDREVEVSVWAGELLVLVPADANVEVDGHVGMGELYVLGERDEGVDLSESGEVDGPEGGPVLTIDANVGMGQLEVRRAAS